MANNREEVARSERVETIARAMVRGSRPGVDPDKLTPAPRGTAGLVPLWRLYEHMAKEVDATLADRTNGAEAMREAEDDLTAVYMAGLHKGRDEMKEAAAKVCDATAAHWLRFRRAGGVDLGPERCTADYCDHANRVAIGIATAIRALPLPSGLGERG